MSHAVSNYTGRSIGDLNCLVGHTRRLTSGDTLTERTRPEVGAQLRRQTLGRNTWLDEITGINSILPSTPYKN